MTPKHTLTIITPYLNAEKFIPSFVSSLLSQTFTNWKCILIDDGSTDHGPSLLSSLVSSDPRFILTHSPAVQGPRSIPGPASARNHGLCFVDSPLVAFCDIDDIWHPQKLTRQLSFHLANSLDISVSAYMVFSSTDLTCYRHVITPPSTLDFSSLLVRNRIPMLTLILNSSLLSTGFSQVRHEDFLAWISIFRNNSNLKYGCLREVLAFYRIHSSNLTSSRLKMPIWTFSVYRSAGFSRLTSLILLIRWFHSHTLEAATRIPLTLLRRKRHAISFLLASNPLQT